MECDLEACRCKARLRATAASSAAMTTGDEGMLNDKDSDDIALALIGVVWFASASRSGKEEEVIVEMPHGDRARGGSRTTR